MNGPCGSGTEVSVDSARDRAPRGHALICAVETDARKRYGRTLMAERIVRATSGGESWD